MNISIVYVSCFMYRNLWRPFLELKLKYIGDKIPFYLCTDGPIDEILKITPGVNVLHFDKPANNNTNYITRLIHYLKKVDTKYVLFWYDDMFPTDTVRWPIVEEIYAHMESNPTVKLVKCSIHSSPFRGNTYTIGTNVFTQSSPSDGYVMNVQPTVFDRTFLLDVMEEVDRSTVKNGPSDFETIGTEIAIRKGYVYLKSQTDIIPVFGDGGVVRAGILLPEANEFLKNHNIHVETYAKNCIYDVYDKANTDTLNDQLKLELRWFNIHV